MYKNPWNGKLLCIFVGLYGTYNSIDISWKDNSYCLNKETLGDISCLTLLGYFISESRPMVYQHGACLIPNIAFIPSAKGEKG